MLPALYPILDVDLCRERRLDPLAVLDAFLAGGARFIQLRDKTGRILESGKFQVVK